MPRRGLAAVGLPQPCCVVGRPRLTSRSTSSHANRSSFPGLGQAEDYLARVLMSAEGYPMSAVQASRTRVHGTAELGLLHSGGSGYAETASFTR